MTEPDLAPGAIPSPNIWHHPEVYELENRAVDRAGVLVETMRRLGGWAGRDVLDVGCGAGHHLSLLAGSARSVVGVEPHSGLVALARRRSRRLGTVTVLHGSATDLPLADRSVDVVHARWAYFFGPGCEPGLAELDRVVRPGGRAFVVDNDPTRSTWGRWFRRGYPTVEPRAVEDFWAAQGWERHPVLTDWRFDAREDLEAVVRIELPDDLAEELLAEHEGLVVDYAVNLWTRTW